MTTGVVRSLSVLLLGAALVCPTLASAQTTALQKNNITSQSHVAAVAGQPATVSGAPVQAVTISGRITDADSGVGIAAADVWLDGTKHRAVTNPEGRFVLSSVEPGTYTLRVRRIGYTAVSQEVKVAANEIVTVDLALKVAPAQLDAVVVTVTGEQRIRELGHVVGRINADSLVREAPISSVTELLTSRVPGLLVQTDGGTVGGDVTLRVRTTNSLWLNPEPIVIVDGVRYTTNPRTGHPNQRFGAGWNTAQLSPFQNEGTSRLNDLNPNDIESIEVVKGPSAATLYGTDAANGVIVITTKQGRPGPARWNVYGRASMSEVATRRYPDIYWGWGSSTTSCTLDRVASGACTQDSVSVIKNPLNDPELTIFGSKPRWEYGTNVSGGSENLRYYFSADIEEAVGPVRLPLGMVEAIKQKRGVSKLPKELLEPNAFNKINLRSTLNAHLGRSTNLRATAGYTQSATRTLVNSNPYTGAQLASPDDHYNPASDPENAFSQTSTENVNRFFGSVGGDSRLLPWLQLRATLGIDLISSSRYSLARPGEAPNTTFAGGVVGDNRTRYLVTSGDLGATASYDIAAGLSGRTSIGAQYVRNMNDALNTTGRGLPPGGASIGAAATVTTTQVYHETVTLGSYLEQMIGINDRLFLTGALRVDGASGFGRDYETAVYPKAGASWIISDGVSGLDLPWLNDLRLRYAFGASGQQARPEWTNPVYRVSQYTVDGVAGNTVGVVTLGNPDLKPERIREHELGLDASAFDNRLAVDLTWNWRRSEDGIQPVPLAPGFGTFGGSAMIWTNVGLIEAHGFEARLNGRLIETPSTSLDISYSYAWHTDKLIDLGGRPAEKRADNPGWAEGYPLGALFGRKLLSYEDLNGDNIIDRNEVVLSSAHPDSLEYLGRSIPPQTQTLVTTLGLFQQRVRISVLLDRQTGFYRVNSQWMQMCGSAARCRSLVDPETPLAEQAQAAAFAAAGRSQLRYSRLERGDFTRLRELSLTADLPQEWARAARMRNASVSLSARNLGLWTDFGGDDPESRTGRIPQARAWTVRVDLGL